MDKKAPFLCVKQTYSGRCNCDQEAYQDSTYPPSLFLESRKTWTF